MGFKLGNRDILNRLNSNPHVKPSALKFGDPDKEDKKKGDEEIEYTYVGGDEDTANERFYYKEVEEKMSDEDWNALSQEEKDRLNNAYKVTENREDWDTSEHWSTEYWAPYEEKHGGIKKWFRKKLMEDFKESVADGTRDDKPYYAGKNIREVNDELLAGFENSTSSDEFTEWAREYAPYILSGGRRRGNVGNKGSSGKTGWN
tara:strand:- start:442 stop:1050 length:609 start_codon:yes stop_codon:yes gene_type:complete